MDRGYNPWSFKELDTTEQLTLSLLLPACCHVHPINHSFCRTPTSAPHRHLSCFPTKGKLALCPGVWTPSAKIQRLSLYDFPWRVKPWLHCMQSFLFFFFLEKNVVLLPNDVPNVSGSPRSNPSAGKRSNTAILVWHQASGFLILPGLLMLLRWKTKSTA